MIQPLRQVDILQMSLITITLGLISFLICYCPPALIMFDSILFSVIVKSLLQHTKITIVFISWYPYLKDINVFPKNEG